MTADAPNLGKQIGPLPLGVWIAAVGGGLGLAYFARKRSAAKVTPGALDAANLPADNTSTQPGAGNLSPRQGDAGDFGGNNPGAAQFGVTVAAPQTNDQWMQLAERRLLGMGFAPLLVDHALTAYLYGGQLTVSDRAVVAEALLTAGPPPSTPPPADPGTAPTVFHTPVGPRPTDVMPAVHTYPAHPVPVILPRGPIVHPAGFRPPLPSLTRPAAGMGNLSTPDAYAALSRHYGHPVDAAWLEAVFHHPVDNAWLNGLVRNPPPIPARR